MTHLQTIINLLQSIDARLAQKNRRRAPLYAAPAPEDPPKPPTPLEERLQAWIAKGGHSACYSVLIRRAHRDGTAAVDWALYALEQAGRIVRIQGKHGWKFAPVVSHTAQTTDDCPLPTPSTPV